MGAWGERSYTAGMGRVARRFAVFGLVSHAAAGCAAINMRLPSMVQAPAAPETTELTTASVPAARVASSTLPPPRGATLRLSEEEQATIGAAIQSAALDQPRAATMPWLDQRSGVGGLVTPVGSPVRQGEAVCRAILISVQRGSDVGQMQGNACRAPGHAWYVLDLRPFQAAT